jgi:phospholipid/cholesterol/gamma-HCH transport system ATP-binding protein
MEAAVETIIELKEADIPRMNLSSPSAVLENVEWTIRRGEFWAVGALPGTGKTDLLYTAAGLQRPLKGIQRLYGRNVTQINEQEFVQTRLRIGMVFDGGKLFSDLTIAENLALPLAYHFHLPAAERLQQVEKVLEITGLSFIANKRPSQTTRNLHQRAGLARALVLKPDLLLVDNPLGGVDPRQGRWWLDFLCQLNAGRTSLSDKPITIVVATDDLRPWTDSAREFAIIEKKHFEVVGGKEKLHRAGDKILEDLLMTDFEA